MSGIEWKYTRHNFRRLFGPQLEAQMGRKRQSVRRYPPLYGAKPRIGLAGAPHVALCRLEGRVLNINTAVYKAGTHRTASPSSTGGTFVDNVI